MSDAPADLVITGCTVLVHDDQEGIGFARLACAEMLRGGVTTFAAFRTTPPE